MHFIPNNDLKRLFNALKSPPHLPTNVLTCCVRWAFRTSWKAPCLVSSSRNAKDGGGGDVGASYSTAGAFYYSDDEEDFFPLNQQEDTIGGIKTDSAYTYDFKAQGSYNKNITITNKRNSLSRSDSDSNSHGDTYSRFFPSKKSVLLGKILSSFTSLINSIEFSTSSSSSSSASSSPRFKQYVWVEIKCIPLSSNNNHPYSGIKYNASPSLPPYFVMSIRVLDVPKAKALMEANVTAASSKMSEQSLVKIPGIWNIFKSVTTKFLFCLDEGLEQLEVLLRIMGIPLIILTFQFYFRGFVLSLLDSLSRLCSDFEPQFPFLLRMNYHHRRHRL